MDLHQRRMLLMVPDISLLCFQQLNFFNVMQYDLAFIRVLPSNILFTYDGAP